LTKAILFLLLLGGYTVSYSQNIVLPYGEYMDTTVTNNPKCNDKYLIYYYHVNARYPAGTESLLLESKEFLSKIGQKYSGSGYITFRFMINCEGQMQRVRVMQVDDDYKSTRFDKRLVNTLNDYIHTLDRWEKGLSAFKMDHVNYLAYLSFRIKNGEVINVIY
jgi:hypothetical protein